MTVGLAQYLTVKDSQGKVLVKWQNGWINETVDGYDFGPFNVPMMISQISSGTESISIDLPVSQNNVDLVQNGLQLYYVATVEQYQYLPPVSGLPQAKTKVAAFTGEFESAEITDAAIVLDIGLNLDTTESQLPIRTFTTILAGSPPKL